MPTPEEDRIVSNEKYLCGITWKIIIGVLLLLLVLAVVAYFVLKSTDLLEGIILTKNLFSFTIMLA